MNDHDGAPPSPNSLAFPSEASRSPSPEDQLDSHTRAHSPAPSDIGLSPSASTFLRTAETLEGLAQQLSNLSNDAEEASAPGGAVVCCCGAVDGRGCKAAQGRERMAEKLVLSGGAFSLA